MSEISGTCFGVGCFIATVVGIVCYACASEQKLPKRKWQLVIIGALMQATGWLWVPWCCYGVYCAARWTMNGIDYQERPPVVVPLEQKTIDLNKVENANE